MQVVNNIKIIIIGMCLGGNTVSIISSIIAENRLWLLTSLMVYALIIMWFSQLKDIREAELIVKKQKIELGIEKNGN